MNAEVPSYDSLPRIERLGLPHSWEFFGEGDQLGTLGYLTPERVMAAVASVRSGRVVSLNLPVTEPDPPLFGREPIVWTQFDADRNTKDDRIDNYFPQGSSQWDGFYHVRAREFGFFGGVGASENPSSTHLGIDVWAKRGIAGRGVLLDVERHLRETEGIEIPANEQFVITPEVLVATAERQGTEVRRGDILLVRSGWPAKYAALDRALLPVSEIPGIHAGDETARLIWDWNVAALVSDLPGIEPVPGDPAVGSLHRRMLPLLGVPFGELFDLEELGEACAERGSYEFLFTGAPMNLQGGAGSPANALAIL